MRHVPAVRHGRAMGQAPSASNPVGCNGEDRRVHRTDQRGTLARQPFVAEVVDSVVARGETGEGSMVVESRVAVAVGASTSGCHHRHRRPGCGKRCRGHRVRTPLDYRPRG